MSYSASAQELKGGGGSADDGLEKAAFGSVMLPAGIAHPGSSAAVHAGQWV